MASKAAQCCRVRRRGDKQGGAVLIPATRIAKVGRHCVDSLRRCVGWAALLQCCVQARVRERYDHTSPE